MESPQLQYWARVRARTSSPLRRGAWYRVAELGPADVLLEVNHRMLRVPRAMMQVLPLRPPVWSVVPRPPGADLAPGRLGGHYAVCPRCCDRAPVRPGAVSMRCPGCGAAFAIAWSDAHWRAFEVLADRPEPGALARARATALRALAVAFKLDS